MSSAFDRLAYGFADSIMNLSLEGKSVLDVGCGLGVWGHLLRVKVSGYKEGSYLVGCDVFKPYLKKLKEFCPYDDLVLCDVRLLPFQKNAVNVSMAFEIIEHLDKQEGAKLLHDLSHISEKMVISTPYGYYEQDELDENKFQRHRSAWVDKDFQKIGFKTKCYGFGRELECCLRKFRMVGLWRKIITLIQKEGHHGIMIIAVKKNRKRKKLHDK